MLNPLRDSILLLILINLTVVAYFLMIYLRGKRATYFGNINTLERTHGFKRFEVNISVLLIKVIIIVLLYLVATNSIFVQKVQLDTGTDYILLIDSSSSMASTDISPNRIGAAKDISKNWLSLMPNSTRIGLVVFSQKVDSFVPLTSDKSLLNKKIDEISVDYAKSGTDLNYALNFALEMLNRSGEHVNKRKFLLFTDSGSELNRLVIAKTKEAGVSIYSFGIGDPNKKINLDDIPEEFRDSVDFAQFNFTSLEKISKATGGKLYEVSSDLSLEESFKKATQEQIEVELNSGYYVVILIALLSILELIVYAKLGAI